MNIAWNGIVVLVKMYVSDGIMAALIEYKFLYWLCSEYEPTASTKLSCKSKPFWGSISIY